jgi:hypothetical protein
MRIGIVSDIHGNAARRAAALDLIGDVDALRDRGARCVQGNHHIRDYPLGAAEPADPQARGGPQ